MTRSSLLAPTGARRASQNAYERADRAIVGLLDYHDRASLFELLWPYGARCYADLGHKVIFCAHADRTLSRIGWDSAEPALRSLVRGLLYVDDDGPQTAVYQTSLGVIDRIPANWLDGKDDPKQSRALLRALRGKSPAAAQRVVIDALRDGVGIATVWDGLRLRAAEVFYNRAVGAQRRHGPVHTVTELNAFAHIWRTTPNTRNRKLMLLQLAGWLALLRDDLEKFFGEQRSLRLGDLGRPRDGAAADLREVFEQPSPDAARIGIDAAPDGAAQYLGLLRQNLYERAVQDHQYKFVAVLHEEARAIHPRWRSRLLAPSITYVPTPRDDVTEMRRRSDAALETAGVV